MRETLVRLVRQDGSACDVPVSSYSLKRCEIPHELPVGEAISVEFTDLALLLGNVVSTAAGRSEVRFVDGFQH
ncbi:hypothetical protein G7077_02990 [Sphingomonas piscis]|uniref:Uncharacterized protein n=1 Tax=Sphingomonas piscis TaxID=2714943 RepID=A0A6G7YMR4_9SPHN|nr:hypothetical protein [Sphingomonas piscis]QIK78028.1 hypothetical protein G7077_02990 [Sphingomonas piscis]